jgi:hypothetical protein
MKLTIVFLKMEIEGYKKVVEVSTTPLYNEKL